jgi:hypothetical protein
MEHLYIVVRKVGSNPWRSHAVFQERRLAKNFIECEQARDDEPKWQFGIVDGPVVNPAEMAEQEAALGKF